MIPKTEQKSADVLVLGGGMAGCMGACAAAMAGRSVVLVDKAWVGGSGESCFAAGDMLYFDPEQDSLQEWLERWNRNGNGMFDPEWMEWYAKSSTEIINMMNTWGMDFEKDADGRFKRKPGRGHNHAVVFPGFKMMRKLRARLEKLGVTIVDRVQVTDLLTNSGEVVGATGFHVRTGQFHIFHAKNTILSTGSCSFKGQYHGQDMESGEGNTMALRAGAEFTNMEFSNCYNSTARDFDICGMSRFQRLGGRFTNALGEAFMDRYDPVNKDGALLHILVRAMTTEVNEGRGPIYFNLKNMSAEDRELSYRIVPTFFAACKSCGIDPFEDSVEWIPGFMGSTSSGSGLTLKSFACDTTVPRLFASGDMANQGLLIGSIAGAGAVHLGWACISGFRAGEGAAKACEGTELLPLDEEQVEAVRKKTFAKLGHEGRLSIDEAIYRIQSCVIPAKYNIIRSGENLKEALAALDRIEEDIENEIIVRNTHELMLYHELCGMLTTARLTFTSALERKESRGSHYRTDYPEMKKEWNVWLKSKLKDGKIEITREPVQTEKFERYGLPVYPL
ncbi:FAD-binding protein [Mailhella massiliensis]|uniref:FAD-dependent oxidoreductase n=1 Tax=Mailhella massiliensis TaxID=1903261 RepID=UPI002354B91D|nr:FAD-binding protein [Mailhella massiliensis]